MAGDGDMEAVQPVPHLLAYRLCLWIRVTITPYLGP